MEPVKASVIASRLGVKLSNDLFVTNICTDSREAGEGSLFVAIPGERVDGHDYVGTAIEQGAALALVERGSGYPANRAVMVPNTVKALLELAAWYRTTVNPQVVGVTGSVGKTTTKDMIAAALSSGFRTIKTIGNQNNEIGAPRTIFSINGDTEAAVVEMGMSGFGEIKELAEAARPQIGVITNIGVNHMEYLGSRENILKAKLELADCLPDRAKLFLCADNDLLEGVEIPRLDVVYYGLESKRATLRGKITGGDSFRTTFDIEYNGGVWQGEVPGAGQHLVQNALAAFGVSVALGLQPQMALDALRDYRPSGMRQKVVQIHGITVVEDCYNASPDSMVAALRTLGGMACPGRRFAVLSDMLELGSMERQGHYESGRLAAQCGIDRLLLWGDLAPVYAEGARDGGLEPVVLQGKEEIAELLSQELLAGDIVWFKASRGKKLEETIENLYALLN